MGIRREIGEAFEKGLAATKTTTESKQGHLVRQLYIVSEELRNIVLPTDKEELNIYMAAMESIAAIIDQALRRTMTRGTLIDIYYYIFDLAKQLMADEDGKYSFSGLASFAVPQAPITFDHTDKIGNTDKGQKTLSVFSFINK